MEIPNPEAVSAVKTSIFFKDGVSMCIDSNTNVLLIDVCSSVGMDKSSSLPMVSLDCVHVVRFPSNILGISN